MHRVFRRPLSLLTSLSVVIGVATGFVVVGSTPAFADPADQTITFNPIVDHTFGDHSFHVSALASSGLDVSFATSSTACTVTAGPNTATVAMQHAGSCAITASQPGDGGASWNAAPDVTQTFTIDQFDQAITFASIPDHVWGDADFAVSASSSSGLGVSFDAVGDCTVTSGPNTTTVHLTAAVAGTCTITASQAGDADRQAAPDVARTFAISKQGQTITFAAPPNHLTGDADFAVSATSSSGLAVTLVSNNADCTVSGTGPFTVHLANPSPGGSCSLGASQAGNASYTAASDVIRTFLYRDSNQTITFPIPATPKHVGDASVDLSVGASASSGLPLTFSLGAGFNACHLTGTIVSFDNGPGQCAIVASQPGQVSAPSFFAAASVTRRILILEDTTKTALSLSPKTGSISHSTVIHLSATVTNTSNALAPSGLSVTFKIGTTVAGTGVTNSSGVVTLDVNLGTAGLAVGKYALSATTAEGSSFTGSTVTVKAKKGLKVKA